MSKEPDNIGSGRIEPGKSINTEQSRVQPDRTMFQSYMQEGAANPTGAQGPVGASPAEIAGMPGMQAGTPNVNSLLAQVNNAQGTYDTIKDQLNTPNLKFKQQHQYLLNNKLSDANNYLASANARLGSPILPNTGLPENAGPVTKFLAYVTDGQNQLLAAKSQLAQMGSQGAKINPADMLLVQIKMSQAQQELEYSSTLLSKAVDIIKQMLNIQL